MSSASRHRPRVIGISTSEAPDMGALGMSDTHLREAVATLAIHLLASGANLAYGGDLRHRGFTELLFELLMRYRQPAETGSRVTDYLAWPVHIRMTAEDIENHGAQLSEFCEVVLIGQDGSRIPSQDRQAVLSRDPTDEEWTEGLTSMRRVMRQETDARIVLGGRIEGYKGAMPGIAEEALLSLQACQPLFLVGGFGGCTRDIAETVGLVDPWSSDHRTWRRRWQFERYAPGALYNGLTIRENQVLAQTPHIEQAVSLVGLGLHRLNTAMP